MRPIPFEIIRDTTLSRLSVPLADFQGSGRMPRVVWARRVVAYLTYEMTGISFPEVATRMGRPNHSSIIDMTKAMKETMGVFPGLADDVAKIEAEVRSIVADRDRMDTSKVKKTVSQVAHVAPR